MNAQVETNTRAALEMIQWARVGRVSEDITTRTEALFMAAQELSAAWTALTESGTSPTLVSWLVDWALLVRQLCSLARLIHRNRPEGITAAQQTVALILEERAQRVLDHIGEIPDGPPDTEVP